MSGAVEVFNEKHMVILCMSSHKAKMSNVRSHLLEWHRVERLAMQGDRLLEVLIFLPITSSLKTKDERKANHQDQGTHI